MSDEADKQSQEAGGDGDDGQARARVEEAGGRKRNASRRAVAAALSCAVVAAVLYLAYASGCLTRLSRQVERAASDSRGELAEPLDPYALAVAKIEEDRGEPVGRKAKVKIPAELKLYKDARRFLAIQEAAARESDIRAPHDFAELAGLIKDARQWVEVPKLGDSYVLYGVGLMAAGRLTHYDRKRGKSVPLFAGTPELDAFDEGLAAGSARLENELKELAGRLKEVGPKEREERKRLLSETAARKKELDEVKDRRELIKLHYDTPKGRQKLFGEYDAQAALARDFGGRAYELSDQASAREFEARLLSFVRPAARSVLEELAAAYQSKFERPLPVTSLVRTEEYQWLLREGGNPNAADVSVPPHTTGLAFDIFYRYMTAAEQEFVMSEIARMEREGRVEALRELRDHYHVFVLPKGRRPSEKAIEKAKR